MDTNTLEETIREYIRGRAPKWMYEPLMIKKRICDDREISPDLVDRLAEEVREGLPLDLYEKSYRGDATVALERLEAMDEGEFEDVWARVVLDDIAE